MLFLGQIHTVLRYVEGGVPSSTAAAATPAAVTARGSVARFLGSLVSGLEAADDDNRAGAAARRNTRPVDVGVGRRSRC